MEFMTVVINLDKRKDRMEETASEVKKLGLESISRFPAIETSPGQWGCILSHIFVLGTALRLQKNVLILEDDVQFINNPKENFEACLKELDNSDFFSFYLGGNICNKITQITEHLGHLSHSQSTHAILYNYIHINTVLTKIAEGYGLPLDLIFCQNLIPFFPCYISIPMIALQRPSYSDIEKTYTDYTEWMEKRFYSNLVRREPINENP
jgi:hypothetical protein